MTTRGAIPDHGWEHRFLVDDESARRVLRATFGQLTRVLYQPDQPVAYSRTLYLDTPDHKFLRSYSSGAAVKLRIRQYASAENLIAPPRISSATYLELKHSAGTERRKVRLELSASEATQLTSGRIGPSLLARLSSEPALDDVIEHLRDGSLTPQVTSWYRRVALESAGHPPHDRRGGRLLPGRNAGRPRRARRAERHRRAREPHHPRDQSDLRDAHLALGRRLRPHPDD